MGNAVLKFLKSIGSLFMGAAKFIGGLFMGATKLIQLVVVLVLLMLIAFFVIFNVNKNQASYNFSSALLETLDIAELSTSEFIYNGIAEVYRENTQDLAYRMMYNATVKVGIQMDDIVFEIHDKILTPILPTITIWDPIIDPASISYMPYNPNVALSVALSACREDARREAEKAEALVQAAEENLKSIVEALLRPIVKDAGYTIEW